MTNRKVSGAALHVGMAVVLAFAGAAVARADDAPVGNVREQALEQRVRDLEKQLTQVKDELRGGYFTANSDLEARVADLERATADGANGMTTYFKNGMKSSTADDSVVYQWKGRVQNDWVWYIHKQGSDKIRSAGLDEQNPEFGFRRIFLGAGGKYYGNVKWEVNIDFSDNANELQDVWMEVEHCGVNYRVGHMKEPFSLDTLTSDLFTTFMERNAIHRSFSPNYNEGFMAWGRTGVADTDWLWQAGVFRDSNAFGDDLDNTKSGEYNVTARFSGRPIVEDDGNTWLHVGMAASLRDFAGSHVAGSTNNTGTSANSPIPFATGFGAPAFRADDGNLFGVEAAYNTNELCFKAEYAQFHGDVRGDSGATFSAWGVEGSYWLTGETNTYDPNVGSFSRVAPKRNFGDGDGMGAWQAAARFDVMNLSDNHQDFTDMNTWTLGLNWWLNPNTRVSMNLLHVEYDNIGVRTNGLAFRFQWDF